MRPPILLKKLRIDGVLLNHMNTLNHFLNRGGLYTTFQVERNFAFK